MSLIQQLLRIKTPREKWRDGRYLELVIETLGTITDIAVDERVYRPRTVRTQ